MTLFEAVAELDADPIHLQQQITIQGHELIDESRALQPHSIFELCLAWLDRHQEGIEAAKHQCGESNHQPRRRQADSERDPQLSLAHQFNLLGFADNQRHNWLKMVRPKEFKTTNKIVNNQSFVVPR